MSALNLYHNLIVQGFKLSVSGDKLELVPASRLTDSQRLAIKQHKSELLSLLAANSHNVTCNNCDHLTLTGTCQRLSKRVIPEALRECTFFELRQKERLSVVKTTPYTQDELNKLLNQASRPLYHHLIDCQQCSLEDARYCSDGMTLGNRFDDLLLCFDDAADKRYKLMNQVIKARVSGRRAFESLFSDNAPLPRQDAPITRKWGNTAQYEAFINHWTACKVCKPSLARYCSEGQRLEKEANC